MTPADLVPWILAIFAGLGAALSWYIGRGAWRDVAEARGQKIRDMEKRLVVLEARVDVLTGEFAAEVARRVVDEIRERI